MPNRLYGDYMIIAFPSFDTAVQAWAPQADITWNHRALARKSVFVRFPDRFKTEAEAEAAALDMAQAWIEKNRRRLQAREMPPEQARVIDAVEALKRSLAKAVPTESRRAQAAAGPRGERTLTFEQFKTAMAECGLDVSTEMLRKSYGALVRLRERNQWSWADTRRKLKQSQEGLGVGSTVRRQPKAARLPISERDWRRIG